MNINTDPIYNQFFPVNGQAPNDWMPFKKYEAERKDFSKPDFTITSEKTWKTTAKSIALTLAKIILFPWGLYEVAKSLIHRIAMLCVCPAQFLFPPKKIDELRKIVETVLQNEHLKNCVGREVVLQKDGQRYCGLLFGDQTTISNGKWALFAPGNGATIEGEFLKEAAIPYIGAGFNVLLVNGPGVGKSQGMATVDRIGDAQETAISFLETAVKAKKIVLAGHSLGAAAIGLAAMKHEFKPDVQYLAIRLMSFDRLSNIVKNLVNSFSSKIFNWSGSEMDSVAASKTFQQKGIHEVIIQGGQDEMMAKASLLEALQKENLMENKTGIVIPNADHCDLPDDIITEEIRRWDQHLDAAAAV